jgi:hypothetical protein
VEGVDALVTELAAHIRAEDSELFPLFTAPPEFSSAAGVKT